jgi:glycosyltransferase involved in cell wall biosynthesis
VRILAVGSVVSGKGYDLLIPALASVADLPWRLTIAGDCTREPETTKQLVRAIVEAGLHDKITILGAVPSEHVGQLYLASDLFVLPSRFESYGMALTEALAHGLPVVSTTAGAIPKTVPAGAGVLVQPDEVAPLAYALRRLLENPSERRQLAANAYAAARALPTWAECAVRFAEAINFAIQVRSRNSQHDANDRRTH